MNSRTWQLVRVCLLLAAAIDLFVGLLSLTAPWAMGSLLDFPVTDTALATVAGGEFLVAAFVYVVIFNNPRRFQPMFFVVALDQFFAAVLPAVEMLRGHVPVTIKTAGPIPLNIALCALFIYAALSKRFIDRREETRYGAKASHPKAPPAP